MPGSFTMAIPSTSTGVPLDGMTYPTGMPVRCCRVAMSGMSYSVIIPS